MKHPSNHVPLALAFKKIKHRSPTKKYSRRITPTKKSPSKPLRRITPTKITPTKRESTTSPKTPKTPTSITDASPIRRVQMSEWSAPSSPDGLVILYKDAREEIDAYKAEMFELFRRIVALDKEEWVRAVVLGDYPLIKCMATLNEVKCNGAPSKHGGGEGVSKQVELIVIEDTASASNNI